MKKELELQLVERYPKIFAEYGGDMRETCMHWGMDCGDGWYDIIHHLCKYLQFQTDKNGWPQIVAAQVKEKFGGLRFYVNSGTDQQHTIIDYVESMSYTICETCGTSQNVKAYHKGWRRTLCPSCNEKYLDYLKEKEQDVSEFT